MRISKSLVASSLAVVLVGIGAADAYLTRDFLVEPTMVGYVNDVRPPVIKDAGPDVASVLRAFELETQPASEQSLLASIVPSSVPVQSHVLLLEGDRFAFLAWTDAADAKTYFMALKEALHRSFSPQVTGLLDQVQVRDDKPTRNILTFQDPSIHEERLIFVRSRERLYEIHIPDGRESGVQTLIEALTE